MFGVNFMTGSQRILQLFRSLFRMTMILPCHDVCYKIGPRTNPLAQRVVGAQFNSNRCYGPEIKLNGNTVFLATKRIKWFLPPPEY